MNRFWEFILIAALSFAVTTAFFQLDKRASQACGYTEAFTRTITGQLHLLCD